MQAESSEHSHGPHSPDEIVAVVDDSDNMIGKDTRNKVHINGALHREAYCYLINKKKQLLLQKRADNHKWDHSAAGHFPFDHTYEEAVVREFEEELGYRLPTSEFKLLGKERLFHSSHRGINMRFVKIFLVEKDIPLSALHPDPGELEDVKYFSLAELKELFNHPEQITTNLRFLLEKYVIPKMM